MDFGFNFISPCDSVTEKTIEFLAVDMTPSVFVREREGGREGGRDINWMLVFIASFLFH